MVFITEINGERTPTRDGLSLRQGVGVCGSLTAAHHHASGMLLNGVPGWSTSTECISAEKVKMPMAMNRNRQHT